MAVRGSRLTVLIRLALINSIGFAGSTVVPLWVGNIPGHLSVGLWFGGLAAAAQLAASAVANLATPFLFPHAAPLALARRALVAAALAYLLTLAGTPIAFVCACIAGGAALGVVLNATNRILAGSHDVQKGYSLFQLIEVCFGASLFAISAVASGRFGVDAVFLVLVTVFLAGLLLLHRLPIEDLLVPQTLRRRSSVNRLPAILALTALAVFFIGQSAINSYMLPIGRAMGIPTATITNVVAASMVFAFTGALLARIVGERFGAVPPVIAVAAVLALTFILLTSSTTLPVFVVGSACLNFGTIFAVPYFFTLLAKLDRSGRYVSVAPAFLLGGVAVGPALAVYASERYGLPQLGAMAAAFVILAALLFATCARWVYRRSQRLTLLEEPA